MSLLDTADGVFMSHAYGWAFSNPVRNINITVTSLSIAVALVIGMVELLQVTAGRRVLDLGKVATSSLRSSSRPGRSRSSTWKARRVEERWTA